MSLAERLGVQRCDPTPIVSPSEVSLLERSIASSGGRPFRSPLLNRTDS